MGTVLLGMSEAVFWRCTPRKLFALWEIYQRVNGLDRAALTQASVPPSYIDQFI
ncbi:hypothetical protein FLT15_16645 [Paenibacillus thiaminolyticus]|nr:hypothetical protein [Paenibacillus thiaminolyticus]NGP59930.1 hypothetical protein [Paenibacillus thiaminolyticus]